MWGIGPWGVPAWGFWWIFPLIGFSVCIACLVAALRFMSTGRGCMCMGGHQEGGHDETAELRGDIRVLRDELDKLKDAGHQPPSRPRRDEAADP